MNYTSYYQPLVRFLVYAFSLNAFTYIYADPDLWGHITFGKEIWLSQHIPSIDHYSYTAAGGEWINHEWLMEVLLFLIYDVWGSPGLLLFRMLVGLSIIHLLSELYFSKSKNLLIYTLYFILFIYAIGMGFAMRPQMATYLFLSILIYILNRYFDGQTRILFLVPVLFLLWVNCHGGVVAGYGIFGAIVLVETIRCYSTKETHWKPLVLALAASGIMLFINPSGYKLLAFLLKTIPQQRDITEWFSLSPFDLNKPYFKALVLLFGVSLLSKKPKRAWELVVIFCAIFYGFKHVRHSVLTILLMTPFVPIHLAALTDRAKKGIPRTSGWPRWSHVVLTWVLVGFGAFQINTHISNFRHHDYQIHVDNSYYPVYGVRFLQDNNLNGNILTLTNWGQYLIWKLPQSRVSADGRYWTVYSPEHVRQNMIFHNGWVGWEHFLKFYPHDIILTEHTNRGLEKMKGWVKIFQSPQARIFVRTSKPFHPAYLQYRFKQLEFDESAPSWNFP